MVGDRVFHINDENDEYSVYVSIESTVDAPRANTEDLNSYLVQIEAATRVANDDEKGDARLAQSANPDKHALFLPTFADKSKVESLYDVDRVDGFGFHNPNYQARVANKIKPDTFETFKLDAHGNVYKVVGNNLRLLYPSF